MGNFLAIVAASSFQSEAGHLFEDGRRAASSLLSPKPTVRDDGQGIHAALFPQQKAGGCVIADDPNTGNWLLTVGCWFHSAGFGVGAETKLLERFQQVGAAQLAGELEGFFNVVLWDAQAKELVLITDIVGSCHAFWRQLPGGVALSGSSLLLAKLQECSLDPIACQEFIHTGIIYEDRTLFTEVRKLAPATIFWFCDGKLKKQQRYWNPASLKPESLRGDAAVDALFDSLVTSVRAVTRIFPNPVCDLTGGYDSRAMVAGFLSAGAPFSATVSGSAESADVTISKSLATMLGVPHLHFPVSPAASFAEIKEALFFTDGEYDLIDYAKILRTHRALAERFQISVNGSFGELARGYYWELLVPQTGARNPLDAAKLASGRYAPGSFLESLFRPEVRIEMVEHFASVIEHNNAGLSGTPNTFQMDATYLGMRMQRWQGRIATSTNRLWPCLSPFIFKSTIEVILQTETPLRKRSLMIRRMLHSRQKELAEFPLEHGYPAVPATWGNFYRFMPILGHYGAKLAQKAGLMPPHNLTGASRGKPPRLWLWQHPEVSELLQPDLMESITVLDSRALRTFLSQSREANFSKDTEWRRLFSLECAVREARNGRPG